MAKADVRLGDKVTDEVTGFQGVVTGLVDYITGCRQALVVPPVKADGSLAESQWFDADRLRIDQMQAVVIGVRDPGPDRPAPRR